VGLISNININKMAAIKQIKINLLVSYLMIKYLKNKFTAIDKGIIGNNNLKLLKI
tara:strand:- start:283 stop:447 length:165 start_codon:yes stop_codon:yes gene_type:complete